MWHPPRFGATHYAVNSSPDVSAVILCRTVSVWLPLVPDRELGWMLAAAGDGAVRVTRVQHGSTARRAGMRAGDEIIAVGGTKARSVSEVYALLTRGFVEARQKPTSQLHGCRITVQRACIEGSTAWG